MAIQATNYDNWVDEIGFDAEDATVTNTATTVTYTSGDLYFTLTHHPENPEQQHPLTYSAVYRKLVCICLVL